MDADNKPLCVEVRPADNLSAYAQGKEEPAVKKDTNKKPILPLALRDTEITEGDVAVMLRVAQDKKAQAGRYKRTPKRVAAAEPAVQR